MLLLIEWYQFEIKDLHWHLDNVTIIYFGSTDYSGSTARNQNIEIRGYQVEWVGKENVSKTHIFFMGNLFNMKLGIVVQHIDFTYTLTITALIEISSSHWILPCPTPSNSLLFYNGMDLRGGIFTCLISFSQPFEVQPPFFIT